MTKNTVCTILFCGWLFLLTIVYLLSLYLLLPLWATGAAVITVSAVLWRVVRRLPAADYRDEATDWKAVLLLCAALLILLYKAGHDDSKYGHWDAWWFWNVRADFLTRPDYWKLSFSGKQMGNPFTYPVAHADYPPFLPLLNGLSWRMAGVKPAVIPYMWSMLSFLLIPAILFLELYPRNKWIGAAVLFFILTQDHFILAGIWQIADGWIALLLMLSVIAFYDFRERNNRTSLLLSAMMLGMCCWVKNEGVLLTGMFLLFWFPVLFKNKAFKTVLCGLALPLAAFVLFKLLLAPSNDLLVTQTGIPWDKLTDPARYLEIGQITMDIIHQFFPALPYLLAAYLIVCLAGRRLPDRMLWFILACFIAYLSVYLITPHNLGWHVSTSVDRLIVQLIPSFLLIIARRMESVKLPFIKTGV